MGPIAPPLAEIAPINTAWNVELTQHRKSVSICPALWVAFAGRKKSENALPLSTIMLK
jgi:phage gp37-like protein